jgi:hypothetical protein
LSNCPERIALGGSPQGERRHGLGGERRQREQLVRTAKRGKKEPIEAILDRPSDHLAEQPVISLICSIKRAQVLRAILLVDDGRSEAVANKEKVQHEPAGSPVAVSERMDALEPRVYPCQMLDHGLTWLRLAVPEA